MRNSLDNLVRALRSDQLPQEIWQKSVDSLECPADYHLRLCDLKGALPDNGDLCQYADDIQHMKLQPDLLHCLLPICLKAWQIDLFSKKSNSIYGGFVEHFSTALAVRSDLQIILGLTEHHALMEFMCDSILDRIDREHELHFSSNFALIASPHRWFQAIGTFAVVFPNLNRLWLTWWKMETPGHAVGVLQYISTLMYEENINIIFSPWTRDEGGGPPSLFETEGFIYDQRWRPENTSFLKSILSTDYIYDALKKATQILEADIESDVPIRMVNDFSAQKILLESRIRQLPILLSKPLEEVDGWVK